jgi:hypothetical protein
MEPLSRHRDFIQIMVNYFGIDRLSSADKRVVNTNNKFAIANLLYETFSPETRRKLYNFKKRDVNDNDALKDWMM